MKKLTILISFLIITSTFAQDMTTPLPFQQIPDYPENYNSGNIMKRFVDGLGYRYYWATEGLRTEDLEFQTTDEARTSIQTIEHLYNLSEMIANGAANLPNIRPVDRPEMSFEEMRKATLMNFKKASDNYGAQTEQDVANSSIVFQSGERKNEFPGWHMINGPISDAIYHVGQVVTLRRASGNPINPNVNVFMGRTGE